MNRRQRPVAVPTKYGGFSSFRSEASRYEFWYGLPDPRTGKRKKIFLDHLNARWLLEPHDAKEIRLNESGIFEGLRGRSNLAARWLCRRAMATYEDEKDGISLPVLPERMLRKLHGMRMAARATISKLEIQIGELKAISRYPLWDDFDPWKFLERATSNLKRFEKRAAEEPSATGHARYFDEQKRLYWCFHVPAIAYGLFEILTVHTEPRILAKGAHSRIGDFEKAFLGRGMIGDETGDTTDTIRRQIYRFRRSPQRKDMDAILRRLLTSDWFGYQEILGFKKERLRANPTSSVKRFPSHGRHLRPGSIA